ncbi:Neural-cadherin [Nymphon striatum]|nr:Neural-cadherin [Nymphon striatum]
MPKYSRFLTHYRSKQSLYSIQPLRYTKVEKRRIQNSWKIIIIFNNQRIIIRIQDVNDEPPYFINRPLPMQAVVELNAPHWKTSEGRFEVDGRSGEVTTRGDEPFMLDKEYVLYVKAEDRNGKLNDGQYQSTPEKRLSISGGKRPPQFYMSPYEATIKESTKKDTDIIAVKAKSFAEREIRYTLLTVGKGAGTFNIGPNDGVVKLSKELDFEDLRQPKSYSLLVTATEDSGGLSTSVELTIKVTDVNDNAPKFELPDYQAHNVPENISPGNSILKVKAMDSDEGPNAEIEYSVDIDQFSINAKGDIHSKKRLDADDTSVYVLTVKATDKGDPQMTGTATVRVYPENRNDEPPKFSQDVYTPNVDENAGPNTLVTTVVASDKDGDNIRYGFVGGGVSSGQFRIEESTGVIRLHNTGINLDKDKYELNVTATDDGNCCKDGTATLHTSTALVVVFITDVNDNRPAFKNCSSYRPQVPEGSPSGSPVITVKAYDSDKGTNGDVVYSIVKQPNQKGTKFIVDKEGDDGRVVSVTVKATDRGKPPLVGICSFKVEITDINDNPPLFDRQEYKENVKQDTAKGANVLRVSASDEDADNNGAIEYHLSGETPDVEYFEINPESGWISLRKDLTNREQYSFRAVARDKGDPPLIKHVTVIINVVDRDNKPPVWERNEYGPVHIKENISVGEKVISIRASSGLENNPTVYYTLMKGSTAQTNKYDTFYIETRPGENGQQYVDIMVNYALDYEMVPQYNLTVRVSNNGAQQLSNETTVYIVLEDVNDEIPLFIEHEKETVLEGLPVKTKVTQVQSIDKDGTYPNNKVYYSIVPNDGMNEYFTIDRDTGEIYTKKVFDREFKQAYPVLIRAEDGAPSVRPNVPPGEPNSEYGTKHRKRKCYGQRVSICFERNLVSSSRLLLISNSRSRTFFFTYHLLFAEIESAGGSRSQAVPTVLEIEITKIIMPLFIYANAILEKQQLLADVAIEQVFFPPAFNKSLLMLDALKVLMVRLYCVSPAGTPMFYMAIKCVCKLFFAVNKYIRIGIGDKNDNPPYFDQALYQAEVNEDEDIQHTVITVTARDKDESSRIRYEITRGNTGGAFAVKNETGAIYVASPLDYETRKETYLSMSSNYKYKQLTYVFIMSIFETILNYKLRLVASDNRNENFTTVVIRVKDVNDNPPIFDRPIYETQITEEDDRGLAKQVLKYRLTLVASDNLNENYTVVVISVKDVNDLPPVFSSAIYETTVTEEDSRNLPKLILKVTASDGDRDRPQNIVYFLTGQGIDEKDKEKSNFAINSTSGEIYVLKSLDRDLPKGRSQWRFTVLAEDEGGDGMVNYAEVLVNLKDINDNDPFFPSSIYNGFVTENSTKDLVVMTMTAVDYDDPNEGTNAQLKYTIEQSPMNDDRQRIFKIDPSTGVIKTAVCCLDRETTPEYIIKVVAEDGGGRKGTGTATIKVNDINDMPPEFTKDNWYAEVEETEGDKIPYIPVLIVSVNDKDLLETNRFSYKVVNKSVGADRFTMVTNSDGTGSLKVAKPLDFEDRNQMYGFNITIQVSDKGGEVNERDHIDTAKVRIKLRDINDNKPEFTKANIETSISEDSAVGVMLTTFTAHDADQRGMSQVSYAIDRSSDKKRQFNISNNGEVRIQRMLDREDTPRHQVKILAIDDGSPPKTATATLTVIVLDINDNAPTFLEDYRPIVMEHTPAHKIIEILATDKDDRSKSNGPPYTFRMDEQAPEYIQELFKVDHDPRGANGDGMAIVKSTANLDREYQKEYLVPIVIKDSGRPPLSGTSTLTVTIGDINDNRMHSGSKEIFVYNYKGMAPNTSVGRVHVNDLDDWDLGDKTFFWRSTHHPNFDLDRDTGMITMLNGTRGGQYFLEFNVIDRQHTQEVTANVTVTVQEITEEAVFSSGSFRIFGTSAEDFIRIYDWKSNNNIKSKYEKFREIMASLVGTDVKNVDIFTVLQRQERPPITDVRFSAHGSPYYKPSSLDGLIALHRDQIEDAVGVNITMIKIDECLYENIACESSCTNVLKVDNFPKMVNANKTSLVGVNAWIQPKCVCGARDYSVTETCHYQSYKSPCLNGGRCQETESGVRCDRCPPGYDGPMCEQTTRSFGGGGYAWFPALEQCSDSHFSLKFITRQSSGLLLYNGPIINNDGNETVVQDFISIELQNGKPLLLIDFGSGTLRLMVNVKVDLNDERWHELDIFWTKETARIVVDNCINAKRDDSQEPPVFDRSFCETKGIIPPFNEYLNLNGPLQLGGVAHEPLSYKWKYRHTRTRFNGCIKDVIHNSRLYDLASPGRSVDSQIGCPAVDEKCEINSHIPYCLHGQCIATFSSRKCICNPGWHGTRCTERTQEKKFLFSSFIKYALSFDPNKYITDIQLRFRTRQTKGELFRATSKHNREYVILEIQDKRLSFRFNLNHLHNSEKQLPLPNITVNDGQWHVVRVLRYGSTASIQLDNGGGRRFNELLDYSGEHQLMDIEKQNVIVGGNVLYVGPNLVSVVNDYHTSCMDDIRFEQRYLPMENGSEVAAVVDYKALEDGCKSDIDCAIVHCPNPLVCKDLFMKYECSCPEGKKLVGEICLDVDECTELYPCPNNMLCANLLDGKGYKCSCKDDDPDCAVGFKVTEASLKMGNAAIGIIMGSIILLVLIVVFIFVVYNRTRRSDHKYGGPDDDVRENIINYDDEGGGEDDMNAYDITPLRIPIDANGTPLNAKPGPEKPLKDPRQRSYPPGTHPDVGDFISDHLDKADTDPNAPPFDDLRNYAYEGGGSTAGSLSSLASGTDDNEQDFDYLNEWGPRFHKLADMYGQGESEED